jgi:hypothetical protein
MQNKSSLFYSKCCRYKIWRGSFFCNDKQHFFALNVADIKNGRIFAPTEVVAIP